MRTKIAGAVLALVFSFTGLLSAFPTSQTANGCCAADRDCCNPPSACCVKDCCERGLDCCPDSECCVQ